VLCGKPKLPHRPQFGFVRKACQAYGLEVIEGAGYEADDVIATLALEVS